MTQMSTFIETLSTPRPTAGLGAIDELLRDRAAVLARIESGRDLLSLARAMLITIAAGSAVFGAVLGTYRGGVQIAFAAIKFPLLMLLTAAVCAPALTAFHAALGRRSTLRGDLALVLCSLGLGSLVLVAQAPLLLLAMFFGGSYHALIMLTFSCCGVAGLVSLSLLVRGVRGPDGEHGAGAALALVMVFAVVGAQMAWIFRPYLVRPRTPEPPFVRSLEGNLIEAVATSLQSARGIYTREAPDVESWPLEEHAVPAVREEPVVETEPAPHEQPASEDPSAFEDSVFEESSVFEEPASDGGEVWR